MPEEVDIPLEWLAAFVLVGWIVALPTSSRANDLASNIEYQRDDESQIVGRVRVVGVPNVALGAMYDYHASSWQDGEPSLAYGVEFLWRKVDAFELSAALEYADLGMTGSYWKRSDAKAIGSDWVEFDLAMASAVFSGYWYWDATDWLSPYIGGGLGVGYVLGEATTYNPRPGSECERALRSGGGAFPPSACRLGSTPPSQSDQLAEGRPEDDVWQFVPVVNVTMGLRFNIRRRGVVKLEGGLYDYWFVGLSGGVQWQ
jgi:opacity protein-like surface antigen